MVTVSGISGLWGRAWLADIVLLVTLFEAAVLLARHRLTGRGPAAPAVLGMLIPGVFFLLALHLALMGRAWQWIALCLALAGVAHAADLLGRFKKEH